MTVNWQFKVTEKGTRREIIRKDLADDLGEREAIDECQCYYSKLCDTTKHTLRLYRLEMKPHVRQRWTRTWGIN